MPRLLKMYKILGLVGNNFKLEWRRLLEKIGKMNFHESLSSRRLEKEIILAHLMMTNKKNFTVGTYSKIFPRVAKSKFPSSTVDHFY